jgi:hypothetical protein
LNCTFLFLPIISVTTNDMSPNKMSWSWFCFPLRFLSPKRIKGYCLYLIYMDRMLTLDEELKTFKILESLTTSYSTDGGLSSNYTYKGIYSWTTVTIGLNIYIWKIQYEWRNSFDNLLWHRLIIILNPVLFHQMHVFGCKILLRLF